MEDILIEKTAPSTLIKTAKSKMEDLFTIVEYQRKHGKTF